MKAVRKLQTHHSNVPEAVLDHYLFACALVHSLTDVLKLSMSMMWIWCCIRTECDLLSTSTSGRASARRSYAFEEPPNIDYIIVEVDARCIHACVAESLCGIGVCYNSNKLDTCTGISLYRPVSFTHACN